MISPEISQNYRHAYRTTQGRTWPGDDYLLSAVIDDVGALASSDETDAAVIQGMTEVDTFHPKWSGK